MCMMFRIKKMNIIALRSSQMLVVLPPQNDSCDTRTEPGVERVAVEVSFDRWNHVGVYRMIK